MYSISKHSQLCEDNIYQDCLQSFKVGHNKLKLYIYRYRYIYLYMYIYLYIDIYVYTRCYLPHCVHNNMLHSNGVEAGRGKKQNKTGNKRPEEVREKVQKEKQILNKFS